MPRAVAPHRVAVQPRRRRKAMRLPLAPQPRLILLLSPGHTWASIRMKLDCTDSFIDHWSKRFAAERLAGLFSRRAGQLPSKLRPT